jgi:hypothetical protein
LNRYEFFWINLWFTFSSKMSKWTGYHVVFESLQLPTEFTSTSINTFNRRLGSISYIKITSITVSEKRGYIWSRFLWFVLDLEEQIFDILKFFRIISNDLEQHHHQVMKKNNHQTSSFIFHHYVKKFNSSFSLGILPYLEQKNTSYTLFPEGHQ